MEHVDINHANCELECPLCSHSNTRFDLLVHVQDIHPDSGVWRSGAPSSVLPEGAPKLDAQQATASDVAGMSCTEQVTPELTGNSTVATPMTAHTPGESNNNADADARDCYICGEAITLRRKRDWQ